MIKLKKLLKESKYAWDRKFGDPLPTFKDIAETHQNKPKEVIKESKLPQLKVPKDVSYYNRDWGKVFDKWGDHYHHYGPSESHMYDWNDRSHYDNVVKEYNAHMKKVAAKLNAAAKPLEDAYKVWHKILDKHRNKDRS